MRPSFLVGILWTGFLGAQQVPFIPVTGPNAPDGAAYLFEDHRGGLWLGGMEGFRGLRYFDGNRFTTPVTDNFQDMLISGIAEDGDGGIWLCSVAQGLYRAFHGHMNKMVDALGSATITGVAPDLLLANLTVRGKQSNVLTRISKVDGAWRTEPMIASAPGVRAMLDGSGNVHYPCLDGYCQIKVSDIRNWRPGRVLPVTHHSLKLASMSVSVMRDRLGCVWMRNYSTALYQCPSDQKPVTLPLHVAGDGGSTLSQLDDGSVVIPSFGRLAIGRPGAFRVITAANGYPSFGSMLVGKDGSIWLSNANGLFVLPLSSRIEYWSQRDGLDGNTWSVLPIGTKVFGISGDNIVKLNDDRARWRTLFEFGGATHLMKGADGTIFVSSRTQGVMQIDMTGRILRQSAPSVVMMLAQAPDGEIWSIGSEVSRVRIIGTTLALEPVNALVPQRRGMDMKVDRDGNIWGCYGGGLLWGRPSHWHLLSRENGLFDNECRSVAIDSDGNIWYGTGDFDLIQSARSANPVIQHISKVDEPGYGSPNFVGTDSGSRIWRGTSNGIYVADAEQGKRGQWLRLSRADGLPGVDTNQRSFIGAGDDSVWFGIDSSIVHISPSKDLVHPRYAPSTFVSGFSWNGGPYRMTDQVGSIEHGADLTAHLGSLQMDRRNALEFRYRLKPEQASWAASRDFDIRLGKLPWGTHHLEVQARLGDGPWSNSSVQAFEVLKPVWLSVPALLGFACVGGFAIAGGQRWRVRQRKRATTALPGLAAWRSAALSPEFHGFEGTLLDGRFKVIEMVARGGFATVWKAFDRQQGGMKCAVKVFRRELVDQAWMMKRFEQEVSALRQIHHPNVVGIYGNGHVNSGAPYLAMEFVDGKTLRQRFSESQLTKGQTANYVRQISLALAEIHSHGICHRDVKPENLMIRASAAAGADLTLIDFSIAIVQDPDETIHGLSRAAGTLYYMAPEQAIGYADASSDIYSLAKIVIEMLTGERLSTLLPNASIDLPERVRELLVHLNAGLSADSIALLAGALEFDPSRRPKQAEVFGATIADDLERGTSSL